MISLQRLDGKIIYVNEDNIQWVENLPDTTITFLNGMKLRIKESLEDVLKKINQY